MGVDSELRGPVHGSDCRHPDCLRVSQTRRGVTTVANLVLAFAEIIAGAVILDAAIKGDSITNVVQGKATQHPLVAGSSGGTDATTQAGVPDTHASSAGFVNPFAQAKGFTLGRTDQGVDASMQSGSPILSPAEARITAINQNWYAGQPQIVEQILTGPDAGKFIYLAEQIDPTVSVGDVVQAGQEIATYAASGTGIEMGWAANSAGTTLARATTGYTEGEVTAAGRSFLAFLQALGA